MPEQKTNLDAVTDETRPGNSLQTAIAAYLAHALIALPIISLIANALAWLKYGVDLPYWDDWRQYATGNAGRIDVNYLFTSANDTLYSVGLLFDSLAVRFLGGNPIAYQFVSMVATLGSLMWLQWRLISKCIIGKLTQACLFSITVLMLQPGSYWGLQSIAYHQAIPLVCVLAALNIILHENWKATWAVPSLAIISLTSGFSYISGAFAMLGLGASVLLFQYTTFGTQRRQLGASGLSLLIPSLLSVPAQLWVIIVIQKGTHRPDGAMAYPWETDFWWYILGKISRSLMLTKGHPPFTFWLTITIVLITVAFFCLAVKKMASRKLSSRDNSLMLIFTSLTVIVSIYLLLVAAGRTNLRPAHMQSPIDIFLFGHQRFHFFWITLIWPWLAAIILRSTTRQEPAKPPVFLTSIVLLAAILWAAKFHGLVDHGTYYKSTQAKQIEALICLQHAIGNSEKIHCPQTFPGQLDTSYANATEMNATFTRLLRQRPIPLGSNERRPLYRLSEQPGNIRLVNAEHVQDSSNDIALSVINNDPNILILISDSKSMENCERLQVSVLMDADAPDIAQVFFVPAGKRGFSRDHSTSVPISEGKRSIFFFLDSTSGFANILRFDPVRKPQTLHIEELEVRCRSSRTGARQ